MLFNLEKSFVKWEDFCWPPGSCGSKTAFSMSQHLFQMSGRSHREPGTGDLKVENSKKEIATPQTKVAWHTAGACASACQDSIFEKRRYWRRLEPVPAVKKLQFN